MVSKVYNVVIWARYVIPVEATNREEAIRKARVVWSKWFVPEASEAVIDHMEISGVIIKEKGGSSD